VPQQGGREAVLHEAFMHDVCQAATALPDFRQWAIMVADRQQFAAAAEPVGSIGCRFSSSWRTHESRAAMPGPILAFHFRPYNRRCHVRIRKRQS
jgi:hypothetical protein